MEDDTETFITKKRKSRRTSSILKPTVGPLLDLDPNQQTQDYTIPLKKARKSSSKRVSFAHKFEIKEFPTYSPQAEKWSQDFQNCENEDKTEDTRDDNITDFKEKLEQQSECDSVFNSNEDCESGWQASQSTRKPITSQKYQAAVNTIVNKYSGFTSHTDTEVVIAPEPSLPASSSTFVSSTTTRQPLGCLTEAVARIPLKSIDDKPITEHAQNRISLDGMQFLQSFTDRSTLDSNQHVSSPPHQEKDAAVDGVAFLRSLGSKSTQGGMPGCFSEPGKTMVFDGTESERSTLDSNQHVSSTPHQEEDAAVDGLAFLRNLTSGSSRSAQGRTSGYNSEPEKTMVFDNNDMDYTEALTCHIQIKSSDFEQGTASEANEGVFRKNLGKENIKELPVSRPRDKFSADDEKTRIFDTGNSKQKTVSSTGYLSVQGYKGDTDSEVFFNKIASNVNGQVLEDKTCVFQGGLDMEETKVIGGNISVVPVGEAIATTDPDMEETKILNTSITVGSDKTLIFQQGREMEETVVVDNEIAFVGNRSKMLEANKTLIFQQGREMEETKVVDSQIAFAGNRSKMLEANQTLIYPQGREMKETKVVDSDIEFAGNRSRMLEANRTLIFQQGREMEETKVMDSEITFAGNRSKMLEANQTLIYPREMEETKVVDSDIEFAGNRSKMLEANKTLIFQQGREMEETKVVDSDIEFAGNRSKMLEANKTLIFQQGREMEETKVVDSDIAFAGNRSKMLEVNRSVIQQEIENGETKTTEDVLLTANKTEIFQRGLDMDETKAITANISVFLQDNTVNKTRLFQSGCDMEETKVLQAEILSSLNKSSLQSLPGSSGTLNLKDKDAGEATADSTRQNIDTVKEHRANGTQHLTDVGPMPENFVRNHEKMEKRFESSTNRVLNETVNKMPFSKDGTEIANTNAVDKGRTCLSASLYEKSTTNKTVLFDGGADMEETKVCTTNIANMSSKFQLPGSSAGNTLIFKDGDHMEMTRIEKLNESRVDGQTLDKGRNRTVLFQQGNDMEETKVLENDILRDTAELDQNQMEIGKTEENQTGTGEIDRYRTKYPQETDESSLPQVPDVENVPTNAGQDRTGDFRDGCASELTTNITMTNITASIPEVLEPKRTGGSVRKSMTGVVGLSLLQQAKDKIQTPSKNKIRLSAPAVSAENTLIVTESIETEKVNSSQMGCTNEQSAKGDDLASLTTQAALGNEDMNMPSTDTPGKSKLDVILAMDVGIDDILPPDDMLTCSSFQSSVMAGPSSDIDCRLGMVNRTESSSSAEGNMNSFDQSTVDINKTSSSCSSGCSLTDTILEEMQRQVAGPLTVDTFFTYLGVIKPNWKSKYKLKDYRCSIIPSEPVDTSDMKGILQAQTIHCPYYSLFNEVYNRSRQEAIAKREECEALDTVYAEHPPEIFSYAQSCNKEQQAVLKQQVTDLRTSCSVHGCKMWKAVRLGATNQYLDTLQKNKEELQNQYDEVRRAASDADSVLSSLQQALREVEIEEAELEEQPVISQTDKEQWQTQETGVASMEQSLQNAEAERSHLELERDSLKAEIEKMKTTENSSDESQKEELLCELDRLQKEEQRLEEEMVIYERCLEWRLQEINSSRATFYFYKDTLYLETVLDGSKERKIISAKISSCLPEKAKPEMRLAHNLIHSALKEQQLITKYIGTSLLKPSDFLRELSLVVVEGRCLAREISSVAFNHYTTYQDSSVCVEFLTTKTLREVDVTFELKLNHRDYSVIPHVQVEMGNISSEEVLKQLESVPRDGLEYFTRLCQAIDLDIVNKTVSS